jgi:hypothetical protein
MAYSLYDATVANHLQILGAVGGFLEKSLTHFQEKSIDPAESRPAVMVPRKQAGHMTCTRPQAERQILLAMRASSTHDPKETRLRTGHCGVAIFEAPRASRTDDNVYLRSS